MLKKEKTTRRMETDRYHEWVLKCYEEEADHYYMIPERAPEEIEEIVKFIRLDLYNKGLFCGAKDIRRNMSALHQVRPLPSIIKIGRIISQHGLTNGRTGQY